MASVYHSSSPPHNFRRSTHAYSAIPSAVTAGHTTGSSCWDRAPSAQHERVSKKGISNSTAQWPPLLSSPSPSRQISSAPARYGQKHSFPCSHALPLTGVSRLSTTPPISAYIHRSSTAIITVTP